VSVTLGVPIVYREDDRMQGRAYPPPGLSNQSAICVASPRLRPPNCWVAVDQDIDCITSGRTVL